MEPNLEVAAAESAWDQAVAGIEGCEAELAAFRPRYAAAMAAGEPLEPLEDELQDTLAGVEWKWPWFELWHGTFTAWGEFPKSWPPLEPAPEERDQYSPEDLAEYRRAGMALLIAQTAAMIFFRDRHISRSHMHQAWVLGQDGDPVQARVAKAYEEAVVTGDLSTLPPYFPGDRTKLQPKTPIRVDMGIVPKV